MEPNKVVPQPQLVAEPKITHRLTLEKKVDELQQKQARLARELRATAEEEMKIKLQLYTLVD